MQVSRNPYDDSVLCERASDHPRRDEVLDGLRAAQRGWRAQPLPERVARVEAALAHFEREREAIAADVTREVGKPIREARGEVSTCLARARHMLSIAGEALADDVLPPLPGIERRIAHRPLGVVLNLAAWNYPLLIPVNVVVPALVAGNAVALKHSERTPLAGAVFARAFAAVWDEPLVRDVVLTHEETAQWVQDPRVDAVAFTGSVAGGRAVQRAARERFVGVGLELGGKDPAYVAEDADLAFTVPNLVEGACYNAGQSCCAIERVYVHRSRYEEVLERALVALADWVPGDPLRDETTLGPMATRRALDVLEAQVQGALRRGARLLAGGARQGEVFFPATLLADAPQDSDAMQEESFGPLLPIRAVADDAEALALMNDSRYGLTASVWTTDAGRADWFAPRLEAGTVFQNRCDYLDPALPWTGWKESGRGVSLSRYGYHHLTRPQGLHLRRTPGL
ncbi:MAG: aldehyde dehydrogenase family protein [Planctomycetota bacterium]